MESDICVKDVAHRAEILAAVNDGLISRDEFNAACASSLLFFASACMFVYEPRSEDASLKDIPFIPRSFQVQYLQALQEHIEAGEDLLTDKSREMGVTWMVLMALVWKWLFEPKFAATVSSMTMEKIDRKGDPDSLFWKIEYLVECLNWTVPWLYPKGFNPSEHRSNCKMLNPASGSVIRGETMGPNLGRSGRSRVMFLDEFAEAEYQEATWAACSRTTECRLVVFTPKGLNFAGRLANPKRGDPTAINRITLHWMLDETKNYYHIHSGKTGQLIKSGYGIPEAEIYKQCPDALPPVYPWYEDAKRRVGWDAVKIAQELDVNYAESADGLMYPQIERARFMKVPYDPSLPLYLSMDYGLSDETALIWFQWDYRMRRFRVIDCFKKHGKTIKWFIPFITGGNYGLGQNEDGYTPKEVEMIERHVAYNGRYTDFYGDPAGKQRNQVSNTSVIVELGRFGIYVRTNSKANSYEARRTAMGQILPLCDFDEDLCADLIDDIRNSRVKAGADGRTIPVHGIESHMRSAFEYFAVNQPHGYNGNLLINSDPALRDAVRQQGSVMVPFDGQMIEIGGRDATQMLRALNGRMAEEDQKQEQFWAELAGGSRQRVSGGWGG